MLEIFLAIRSIICYNFPCNIRYIPPVVSTASPTINLYYERRIMQQNKSTNEVSTTDKRLLALKDAHGPVLFNMTNDYLFRAVLQTNHNVLKGLVCSLLHLDEKDIK